MVDTEKKEINTDDLVNFFVGFHENHGYMGLHPAQVKLEYPTLYPSYIEARKKFADSRGEDLPAFDNIEITE